MGDDFVPPSAGAGQIAQAVAGMREMLAPILEGAKGYKEECMRQGFGERAADDMAVQFHEAVLSLFRNKAFGGRG